MPMIIKIVNPFDGQETPLGTVSQESLAMVFAAAVGQARPEAIELRFNRTLGQSANDPGDDAAFKLMAGEKAGEVLPTTATMEIWTPGGARLGEFAFRGISLTFYDEDDGGDDIVSSWVLRASGLTYTPRAGAPVISLDIP